MCAKTIVVATAVVLLIIVAVSWYKTSHSDVAHFTGLEPDLCHSFPWDYWGARNEYRALKDGGTIDETLYSK